jgi:hypothetical protein
VLLLSGAAAMFLASNAFQAGSLAASQPGLTIVDPLVAGALGVVLFGESLRHNPLVLSGEVLAVALVIASVIMLSQSPLVQDEAAAEVGSTGPAAAVEKAENRVPDVRLPRAIRRPFASLAHEKGMASDPLGVRVRHQKAARRPGGRNGMGKSTASDGHGEGLVNQL